MQAKRIPFFLVSSAVVLLLIAVNAALPLESAKADGDWYAEFFDNQTLSGSPIRTWTEPWIGSDWGLDAPAPGLRSEHFSIRWTRTWELKDSGTYQFCAMADDGVRILVDNVLVLDEWHGNNGIAYCGSQRLLSKGEHEIKVEYYEDGGNALIYVWWEEVEPVFPYVPALTPAPAPASVPSVSDDGPAPFEGWYGEYFGNRSLAGKPDLVRLDPWIGFEWGRGSPFSSQPRGLFSARWRRSAQFEGGYYRFCAMADDGVRIWVDDALVLDEWHNNNGIAYCGTHYVAEGVHVIHVEYYEDWGNALIYVWWEKGARHS